MKVWVCCSLDKTNGVLLWLPPFRYTSVYVAGYRAHCTATEPSMDSHLGGSWRQQLCVQQITETSHYLLYQDLTNQVLEQAGEDTK